MSSLSRRDLWQLVVLTVTWGFNWPVMKIGVTHFPPITSRMLSMIGGLAVLALIVRQQKMSFRVPREHWRELFWLGIFNMVIWFTVAIYAVKMLSSGRAAILGYTLPIWTALWGIVFFGEHPGRRLWLGIAAATAGVLLLLSSEFAHMSGRPLGMLLMLVSAAAWGYGTHLMRRRRLPTPLPVITFWTLFQSFASCLVVSVVLERDQWVRWPDAVEWGAILYNSFVIFGLAQLLWFRLATVLSPVSSTLSVMLIPVTGLFSGMWILGEQPAWQDYAALACILVAIATVLLPATSRRPAVSGAPRAAGGADAGGPAGPPPAAG